MKNKRVGSLLSEVRPFIRSLDEIPTDLMVSVLKEVTFLEDDWEKATIANKILPESADYLPSYHFSALIQADMSDAEATEKIEERKVYVKRLQQLLPAILSHFKCSTDNEIHRIISRVDDCCYDFPLIAQSPSEARSKKETVSRLNSMANQLKAIIRDLATPTWQVNREFSEHQKAKRRVHDASSRFNPNPAHLVDDLEALEFAIRATLLRDQLTDEKLHISHNKKSYFLVKHMHQLCFSCDGPELVTTPGSDFANLCSLVYELASGSEGVSLSGAINRYSRSEERREFEAEELELQFLDSDMGHRSIEADNFHVVRDEIARLDKELEFWRQVDSRMLSTDLPRSEIAMRIVDVQNRILLELNRQGPFLIWASQLPIDFEALE